MLLALVGIGSSFGLAWALPIEAYAILGAAMAIWVLCSFVRVGDQIAENIQTKLTSVAPIRYRPLGFIDWLGTSVISIIFGAFWPFVLLVQLRQWWVERSLSDDADEF